MCAPDGYCLVLQLNKLLPNYNGNKANLNGLGLSLLKALLERADIKFVGVNAVGDQTRIQSSLDLQMVDANVINLSTLAVEKAAVARGSRLSLQELVRVMLGKSLPKPTATRVSRTLWKNPDPLAIKYAATDAYASVLLDAIIKQQSPAFDDYSPAVSAIGSEVFVLAGSGAIQRSGRWLIIP